MEQENEQFDDLPQSLIDELKAHENSVPLITARADRQVASTARQHFSLRRNPVWKSRPAWAAVAATILVAVLVTQLGDPVVSQQDGLYADIDNSGQIDIADVLALARSRDAEQITQAELDTFAMRIVSLSSGGDAS